MKQKTLVSIVTEAAVEKAVVEELMALGVDSYATSDVRGRGPRKDQGWEPKEYSAVRIDVLCDENVARAISAKLSVPYLRGYSMTITVSSVSLVQSHRS
jgi:nitrogen regulatory protein PII